LTSISPNGTTFHRVEYGHHLGDHHLHALLVVDLAIAGVNFVYQIMLMSSTSVGFWSERITFITGLSQESGASD
jgi:hypothetical protein